ncbi:Endonuclease/exonuclease/phosphatase [Russula vinacea]|nr:Endonuclease/exonuclease/phosphatase [Russula vinacea]
MTQLGNPVSIPFPFRLATWNLRYDVQPDNIPVATSLAALPDPRVAPPPVPPGEQPWSARRVRVAQRLCASLVDLVGFQEALVRQVHDLEELLGSEFAWVGVGRDDGVSAGEFNPIFYRRTAFTLLETDTFWLSHEPFKPGSHFPGACCPRLATFALFQTHVPTAAAPAPAAGKHHQHELGHGVIALINTHLDQVSDAQRRLGAALVLHRARYEARIRPGVPVFVTGDLNSSATGSDGGAYAFSRRFPLHSNDNNHPAGSGSDSGSGSSSSSEEKEKAKKEELVVRDMRCAAPRASVGGQWATFTGFQHRKKEEACIDFVFGRSDGVGWEAKGVFVETALSDDGVLASDHRLVVADVVIS